MGDSVLTYQSEVRSLIRELDFLEAAVMCFEPELPSVPSVLKRMMKLVVETERLSARKEGYRQ